MDRKTIKMKKAKNKETRWNHKDGKEENQKEKENQKEIGKWSQRMNFKKQHWKLEL